MIRWLVTGGCGFIGSRLVGRLVRSPAHRSPQEGGPEEQAPLVRVFDDLSVGTEAALAAACGGEAWLADVGAGDAWPTVRAGRRAAAVQLVRGDVRDPQAIRSAARGADVVVHLAASTGVPRSVENPLADAAVNVTGLLHTLEAARHGGATKLVLASSGAPLGNVEPPLHEGVAARPISPYGASKLAGEAYCSAYHGSFGLAAVALRFSNVYGPGSIRKGSVVAKFIRCALAGEPLEIYGNGNQTRDFLYVDDLVEAVVLAAAAPDVGGEVFHIATGFEERVGDLADRLARLLAARGVDRPRVVYGEPRTGDVVRSSADPSKAAARLGWRAGTPLETGLERTVDWFLDRREPG